MCVCEDAKHIIIMVKDMERGRGEGQEGKGWDRRQEIHVSWEESKADD